VARKTPVNVIGSLNPVVNGKAQRDTEGDFEDHGLSLQAARPILPRSARRADDPAPRPSYSGLASHSTSAFMCSMVN
jgi:hypothetical protein